MLEVCSLGTEVYAQLKMSPLGYEWESNDQPILKASKVT